MYGMSLSKKGKPLRPNSVDEYTVAGVISLALRQAADNKEVTIKMVANWTGASERTVKNWFSGKYSPSAEHLVVLMRYCDGVMSSMMRLANRGGLLFAYRLDDVERRLVAALHQFHELKLDGDQS